MLWKATAREARTAYRKELVLEQELDAQAWPVAVAVADRNVGVVVREVDVRRIRANVEIDVGVRGDESSDAREQPARGERRHDGDSQLSRIRATREFGDSSCQFGECSAHSSGK